MFNSIDPSFLPAIGIVFFAGMAVFGIRKLRKEISKHQQAVEEMEQMEADENYTLPDLVTKNARVVEKRFSSDVIGTKSVKQVSSFFVTFFTEDGETVEYPVPRELFEETKWDKKAHW
ncbi:MAG: hypothetical protein IJX47_04870 [Clostridia bacterium]|nr:hypothetical protein [Clostridia bacterium]